MTSLVNTRCQAIRKLLQLKLVVMGILDLSVEEAQDFNFDRFCFYGCYCLPDKNVHDDSPGIGKPVDPIDNSCKVNILYSF